MSRISDIHDQMISTIESTLTGYMRLPNPYEPSENTSLYLRRGFAVGFGSATNTERMICEKVTIGRTMTVVLINEILTTETNSASRGSFEKLLMEDVFTLIKTFENDVDLSGTTTRIKYSNDSGIQYVESESERYILVEINFSLEYFENLI